MSAPPGEEFAPDEFDGVPEDGPREGAHRGHPPTARVGSRELAAIVVAGVLTLGVGTWAFIGGAGEARPAAPSSSAPAGP